MSKIFCRYYYDYKTALFCKKFYETQADVKRVDLQKFIDKFRIVIYYK